MSLLQVASPTLQSATNPRSLTHLSMLDTQTPQIPLNQKKTKKSNFSLLTSNGLGHMKLWSTKKNTQLKDFKNKQKTNTSVMKILPNKKGLFINGENNHLYKYNILNGNLTKDLGEAHKYSISSMECTPDSKY